MPTKKTVAAEVQEPSVNENINEVIYGVYDNRSRNIFVRINDFLIDHTKVSIKDKSYFFHLLGIMVDAGIPLLKSLKILVNRTENKHLRRVIATIAYNIENKGQNLANSMQKFPGIFTESEVGIVKSGEESGQIDKMMTKLAKQLEDSYELHLKISGAFVYPATVIGALLVASSVVIIFVIPKLQSFFTENNVTLPLPTQILIDSSAFISQFWVLILMLIVAFLFIGNFYINTESGRFKWDHFLLKVPVVGKIMVKSCIIRFVRLLEVLFESGLPITKCFKIISESMGNEVYKRKFLESADRIAKGEKISDTLEGADLLFPVTLVEMLRIGESSATLNSAASKMASHFEREIDHDIKNTITILEPTMIILIGLGVVGMAFAIMAPIFNLTSIV